MNRALAKAHIDGQERLRRAVAGAMGAAWSGLGSYNEGDVPRFLARAVPLVRAGQRQSVALTEAYLARSVGRGPMGLDPEKLLRQLRNGTPPDEVYRRPFVTVWTALGAGKAWGDAVAEGLDRATSAAATDVQLASRQALRDVGNADEAILGYQRVPDGNACEFCLLIADQRYTTDALQPVHNHCGCSVDVILATERGRFSGVYENDPIKVGENVTAEVREHGELGPVLVNAEHDFTQLH